MQNDLTRETKFLVSSRPAIRAPTVGLNLGKEVRSSRRREKLLRRCRHRRCCSRRWNWSGPWSAGLDCYRWDARVWPYLENANLISVGNGGRPCRKTIKYTTNATGATNPTHHDRESSPVSSEWLLQEGMRKRLYYVSICFSAQTRHHIIMRVIFEQRSSHL